MRRALPAGSGGARLGAMRPQPASVIPAGQKLLTGHFDEGPGYCALRDHGSGDWLAIYTVAGAGRISGAPQGRPSFTVPGDIVLFRPGTYHDYRTHRAVGRWELLWAHVHPRTGWLELLAWPEIAPGIMRLQLDARTRGEVMGALRDAHALASGPLARREPLAMNALERAFLWCDAANLHPGESRLDPRIRAAMEALCRDLDQRISVSLLAGAAGLSPSRFAHLFRAQVGQSVIRYRERQRLSRACQLLGVTDHQVAAVAKAVGFANPFHFSTRFRRFAGLSPRAYRRRHRPP
jgi:AraC family transcriptional regulator, arabinose operon regulatory protein